MRSLPAAAAVLACSAAKAAASQPGPAIGAGSALQLILSLAVVLGVIFALTLLLKRLRIGAARTSKNLIVLDELVVGPKERLMLLKVGDRQVLIGLAPSGFVSLAPLAQPIEIASSDAGPKFADRLRGALARSGKP